MASHPGTPTPLAIFSSYNVQISRSTFTRNGAERGGGVALYQTTNVVMSALLATGNVAQLPSRGAGVANPLGGNGGFLLADNTNTNVMIVKSSFVANRAGKHGGALFFGTGNSYLSFLNLTLTSNLAESGNGGAIYVGSGNTYISFNGFLPQLLSNTRNTFSALNLPITGGALSQVGLNAVGYMVVVNALLEGSCSDNVRITDGTGAKRMYVGDCD